MKTLAIVLAIVAFALALLGIWNPPQLWQFWATSFLFTILAVIIAGQAHANAKRKDAMAQWRHKYDGPARPVSAGDIFPKDGHQ